MLSSVSWGFASAEATKGLSARPLETFGALLLKRMGGPQVNWFLVDGGEGGFLAFLCFAGFRLCGGDQRAFRSPFGNLRGPPLDADRVFYKKWISCGWQGKGPPCFFCFAEDFASAEATKGLSDRPLETFGAHPVEADGDYKKIDFLRKARERAFTFFSVSQKISPLRRQPKGFPVALWKPSGPTLLKRMGTTKK